MKISSYGVGLLPKKLHDFDRWITQVLRNMRITPDTIALALSYMHRAVNRKSEPLRTLNALRDSSLASIIVAQKYLYDIPYSNRSWAGASGLSLQAINSIERTFLGRLDYQLWVSQRYWAVWLSLLRQLQPVVNETFGTPE